MTEPNAAPVRSQSQTDRSQRGVTLVETLIAASILVAVVAVSTGGAMSIEAVHQHGDAEVRQRSASRNVVQKIARDLVDCTMARDPVSNARRYRIDVDPTTNRQILTFNKLAGARLIGGEVQADWSSDIVIAVGDNGVVTQTQDGRSIPIATGITELVFETTLRGSFKITAISTFRDPVSGKTETRRLVDYIKPKN